MESKSVGDELPTKAQPITRVPKIAAPDPAAAAPISIDETIEIWFAKHFHNLGALLDERLYNIIHAAKEDLKAELRKL